MPEPVTLTFADQEVTIWNKQAPGSAVTVSPATLTGACWWTADATVTFDPTGLSDVVGQWNSIVDNIWEVRSTSSTAPGNGASGWP